MKIYIQHIIHPVQIIVILLVAGIFFPSAIQSQDIKVVLSDQTEVDLYKANSKNRPFAAYYYSPVNLRFSRNTEGDPEFSMLTYREAGEDATQGGIMHWLLVWGLTSGQEEELSMKLKTTVDSTAVVMSSIALETEGQDWEFEISSDKRLADILRKSVKSIGRVPVFPGTKMAISFHFSGPDADYFIAKLNEKNGLNGIKVRMKFSTPGHSLTTGYDPDTKSIILETDLSDLFNDPELLKAVKQY